MEKKIEVESIKLAGFEVVYDSKIKYNKDKVNTAVHVTLEINGEQFTRTAYMWQFEVSGYLSKYGADF